MTTAPLIRIGRPPQAPLRRRTKRWVWRLLDVAVPSACGIAGGYFLTNAIVNAWLIIDQWAYQSSSDGLVAIVGIGALIWLALGRRPNRRERKGTR